jgi:hypothetical protein
MSTRMTQRVVAAVGAGLLLATSGLALAGSAAADDSATPNPYKFSIPATPTTPTLKAPVDIDGADPALTCANFGAWTAKVPGKQDAITVAPNGVTCSGSDLMVAITITTSPKKNAVIKLTSTTVPGGTKVVKTFVVKVTGKTGNPGKGNKPA